MIQSETELLQHSYPMLFKKHAYQLQNSQKNNVEIQQVHCEFLACQSISNSKLIKNDFKHKIELIISGEHVFQIHPFSKYKMSYFQCTCEYSFEIIYHQTAPQNFSQRANQPLLTPVGLKFIFGKGSDEIVTLFIQQRQTQKLLYFIKILQTKFIIQRGFYRIYKPIRRLGSGTTSTVYSALNIYDNKKYAIKGFRRIQNKSLSYHEKNQVKSRIQMAFEKEFKIWKDLKHKNIGKLFTVFETDNSTYMVTEELHQTLHTLLTLHGFPKKEQVKYILKQLLEGLVYIHSKGIMHRDIKLENIMIRKEKDIEDKFTPVIIDFGLAEYCSQSSFLFHKCGTPGYTAPEILDKSEKQKNTNYNEKCDMFSLGIIAYTLMCKKFPFHSDKISEVIKLNSQCCLSFDKELQELIGRDQSDFLSKLLVRDPLKRMSAEQALNHAYFGSETQKVWGSTNLDLPI